MKLQFILFILIFGTQSCAQKITEEELLSRHAVENLIEEYLKNEVYEKNYISFSSNDKQFVILIQNPDSYHEYYFDVTSPENIVKMDSIIKKIALFKVMFDTTSYQKGYTSFESDFYKNGYELASGSVTYFSMITKDKCRFGESRLSFYVKPNPIKPEIYLYFTERLLKYAR